MSSPTTWKVDNERRSTKKYIYAKKKNLQDFDTHAKMGILLLGVY